MPTKIIKPKKLQKGDTIGIISPASSPIDLSRIDKGIDYLLKLGYKVKEGKHIRNEYGYLSGKDEERLEDLHSMFQDKEVKAIFCTRGGYGTPRILNKINYNLIRNNPKILVGYSDITALQLAIFKKTGLITFSGPMVAVEMFSNINKFTEEFFWQIITSTKPIGKVSNPEGSDLVGNMNGKASGRIIGGNLSLALSIFGTSLSPNYDKSIFIFEDVDEEPYRIDRYLSQLRNSGLFKKLSGIIISTLIDCEPRDKSRPSLTLEQVLNDYFSDLKIPIIQNLQYGHIPIKITIPFGIKTRIDSNSNSIEFLESAVR